MLEKGVITPELSESMLAAVAPDIVAAARAAQQNQSVGPIPDELSQALQGEVPAAQEAPAAEQPAEEVPNAEQAPIQLAEPTTTETEITE
jgi:hypothetical protein